MNLPAFSLPGFWAPLSSLAALLINHEVLGRLVSNSNVLFAKALRVTGNGVPSTMVLDLRTGQGHGSIQRKKERKRDIHKDSFLLSILGRFRGRKRFYRSTNLVLSLNF